MEWLVLNSNTCNHFSVYKYIINNEKNYYSYMILTETIRVKTIAIQVCKEVYCNSSKNEIIYQQFANKLYMYSHLNVCKQMTDVELILSLFGLFLWHINPRWLFKAKSSLFLYIEYIGFALCQILFILIH